MAMTVGTPFEQELSKRIGARIKHRREELGYSQTQLAVLLSVTFQQVQKYESGRNRPFGPQNAHFVCGA